MKKKKVKIDEFEGGGPVSVSLEAIKTGAIIIVASEKKGEK